MRELPADLVRALRRAREIEKIASDIGGLDAQRRALNGTAAIMLAGVQCGWYSPEIAVPAEMSPSAVRKRISMARRLYRGASPALVFDAPTDRPPQRRAVLLQPVEQREWLTCAEAAAFAGHNEHSVWNWLKAGLLPNTQTDRAPFLFLRADLVRVLHGPRYLGRGVSYTRLRAQIHAAAI